MKRINFSAIVQTLIVVNFLLLPLALVAQDGQNTELVTSVAEVYWFADDTLVDNAESTLMRMEHGVYGTLKAVKLEPGDAYTIWWIIFNYPENCSHNECGPD